jgi:hypothetical protein
MRVLAWIRLFGGGGVTWALAQPAAMRPRSGEAMLRVLSERAHLVILKKYVVRRY